MIQNVPVGNFPVFKFSSGSGRMDMFYGVPALKYHGLLEVQSIINLYTI